MNTTDFPEINRGVKPLDNSHSAIAWHRPRFIVATSACRMNSEKCVFRERHSDSTMAKSDGLMRNRFDTRSQILEKSVCRGRLDGLPRVPVLYT